MGVWLLKSLDMNLSQKQSLLQRQTCVSPCTLLFDCFLPGFAEQATPPGQYWSHLSLTTNSTAEPAMMPALLTTNKKFSTLRRMLSTAQVERFRQYPLTIFISKLLHLL